MNKKRNNFFIFFIVFIIALVSIVAYLYVSTDGQFFSNVLENINSEENKENYNGIYTYWEDLNGSKTVFAGCVVSRINHHILIINDSYYTYKSSCIGTFFFEEGKVKDLDIKLNEDKSYYIYYKDKRYNKDNVTNSLVLRNNAAEKFKKINLTTYSLLIKESQFNGEYYNIDKVTINGLPDSSKMTFSLKYANSFFNVILMVGDSVLYDYSFKNYTDAPELYPYGAYIVAINKDEDSEQYSNKLVAVSKEGTAYNLDDMFPIVVNGVELDTDKSIHVSFNKKQRNFRIIISNDKKLCDEKSTEKEIAYYEFSVDYDYSLRSFTKPKFERLGFTGEDCDYINGVIRREL